MAPKKTTADAPATEQAPALDLSALETPQEHTPTAADINVPEQVKAFVNAGHEYWKTAPKKWREVVLATDEAVTEVTRLARRFAKATGRTFRIKKQANTKKLVYKVTDPRGSGNAES